jgi:putative membrane protein
MRRPTTTFTARNIPFRSNRVLQVLFAVALLDSLYSALRAFDLHTWILENLFVAVWLALFLYGHRRLTMSDTSYSLMLLFHGLHEYGAQYTYSRVPLGEWMRAWLHTGRNEYDRLVHFCAGLLLSYVIREILIRSVGVQGRWRYRCPVLIMAGFAAMYEMLEAWVAVLSSGDAQANPYLSWQGDPWDSQKDMFASTLGAGITMLALFLRDQLREWKMLRSSPERSGGIAK